MVDKALIGLHDLPHVVAGDHVLEQLALRDDAQDGDVGGSGDQGVVTELAGAFLTPVGGGVRVLHGHRVLADLFAADLVVVVDGVVEADERLGVRGDLLGG